MKKFIISFLAICLVLPACATNISRKMQDSTVLIHMKVHRDDDNKTGWGSCSGVYIKKNLILSAAHCVAFPPDEGLTLKEVWIRKDNQSERAVIVRVDVAADLLLLYTPLEGTPVKLARKVIRGENCWVIGNPLGIVDILTKGIVNKINLKVKDEKAIFIVVDAVALPGNSGGAVVDRRGHLIGILTRSTSLFGSFGAAGLGLAVDLATIREFLRGIK
jgi:S1-C subfamily serine protease